MKVSTLNQKKSYIVFFHFFVGNYLHSSLDRSNSKENIPSCVHYRYAKNGPVRENNEFYHHQTTFYPYQNFPSSESAMMAPSTGVK